MTILQTSSVVFRKSDPLLSPGHFYQVQRFQLLCLRLKNFMNACCGISLILVYGSSYHAMQNNILLLENVFNL
jgi:hypothetical protein